MKEMFSKIISFLIGFCSKLFGKDETMEKAICMKGQRNSNLTINLYGGIKMTYYCNSKENVLNELELHDWTDMLIQHPDMTTEKRFSDAEMLAADYVRQMREMDALLVFHSGDSEMDSIILLDNVDSEETKSEQGGKE